MLPVRGVLYNYFTYSDHLAIEHGEALNPRKNLSTRQTPTVKERVSKEFRRGKPVRCDACGRYVFSGRKDTLKRHQERGAWLVSTYKIEYMEADVRCHVMKILIIHPYSVGLLPTPTQHMG